MNYENVYLFLCDQHKISLTDCVIYSIIHNIYWSKKASDTEKPRVFYGSNKLLGETAKVSESTVTRSVTKLVEVGLLKREILNKKDRKERKLYPSAQIEIRSAQIEQSRSAQNDVTLDHITRSLTKKKNTKKKFQARECLNRLLSDTDWTEAMIEKVTEFFDYRQSLKAYKTEAGVKKIIKDAEANMGQLSAAIDSSMENEYQAIYPPKGGFVKTKQDAHTKLIEQQRKRYGQN